MSTCQPTGRRFPGRLARGYPGTQGACPGFFATPLLQVILADRLHHLPGFRTLPMDLMDQRQACNSITISSYLNCKAVFDDLGKVLRGSFQLIAVDNTPGRDTSPLSSS